MKILINTPDTKLLGGVANHYKGLWPCWTETVRYNFIGSRRKIDGLFLFPFDLIKFVARLVFGQYDVVVLNPSLTINSTIRDAFFLLLACPFSTKKVVFFHGWEASVAEKIARNPKVFSWIYGKADCVLVLASSFKMQLASWGLSKPIYLTSTKFDSRMVEGRYIHARTKVNRLLFLARIEEEKGIYIALSALKALQSSFPELSLKVVGDGGALRDAVRFAEVNEIKNVDFCGLLTGSELSEAFLASDLYLLPTYYGEGMPTSVLEAMAFGLPVISRPVGGIVDFFISGRMGELISSTNPIDFAASIKKLIENESTVRDISVFNREFATENFAASKVAKRLESIFSSTLP